MRDGHILWAVAHPAAPNMGTDFYVVEAESSQDAVDKVCLAFNLSDDNCDVEPLEFTLANQYGGIAVLSNGT